MADDRVLELVFDPRRSLLRHFRLHSCRAMGIERCCRIIWISLTNVFHPSQSDSLPHRVILDGMPHIARRLRL